MGTLFAYSITVSLILLLAYGGYRLSRSGSAQLRRATLLGIYALAFIAAPALLSLNFGGDVRDVPMPASEALPEVTITTDGSSATIFDILLKIYVVGAGFCLLMTLVQLVRVSVLLRASKRLKVNGLTVYVHNRRDLSPFSFGRIVVACAPDIDNEAIMTHEGAHVARHHTLDLCIAQLAATLCWYCPVAWQLRRELKLVHEFQADDAVIRGVSDSGSYCRLLVERAAELRILAIANSFNHNNLKQRIMMMQTPPSGRSGGKWRVLLSLSAIVCAVALLSVPAVSGTIGQISQSALQSRGLDMKGSNKAFVVYGANIYADAVKSGNFEYVSDFEAKNIDVKDVDGVIFPRIGAVFCTDKKVLERLTPGIRKYIVDGKMMSAKEFSAIPASDLWRVVVSGHTLRVHTRNWIDSRYVDPLEFAVKAETKQ
ncbi:MAG: M56 family metallopeptidase [Muribaculaceae bacterium]|nr:M56 family metallopeptidase [Muribaculaceae bacterium]